MVINTVMTRKSQKLCQKLSQERYCNVLVHCEYLGDGMVDQEFEQK